MKWIFYQEPEHIKQNYDYLVYCEDSDSIGIGCFTKTFNGGFWTVDNTTTYVTYYMELPYSPIDIKGAK